MDSDKSKPMPSAPLVYDENGNVAWDKMWGSYCYLAKEGGPAHRDTLLKSKGKSNDFNSEKYRNAVAEIIRALNLLIPNKVIDSKDGWVGIQFLTSGQAKWFNEIINLENVECKIEDKTIFLPVNDDFVLEKEIKNDVTVVGKAYHYWKWHQNPIEKLSIILFGKDIHKY
jgi:sirohydrochlorin cobaltochelatase